MWNVERAKGTAKLNWRRLHSFTHTWVHMNSEWTTGPIRLGLSRGDLRILNVLSQGGMDGVSVAEDSLACRSLAAP